MKKSKFYWLMTLILSFFICHTVLAGCPSGQTEDAATGHCIKSASSCNGKCTYYYDTTTHDLRFEKNANVPDGEEVIIPKNIYSNITGWHNTQEGRTIKNVTIGEGITGAGVWAISTYGSYVTGCSSCTLKLPSTFKSQSNLGTGDTPFWNISFGTIDASALKNTGLSLNTGAVRNIIVDPDANTQINIIGATNYNQYASNVKILCKGTDLKACTDQISYPANRTTITPEYYKDRDSKGNIIEQWGPEGKKTYSYKYYANGDYMKYDGDGNFLGHFTSDGSKRRIYRIDEAVAVVSGKNNFKIMYR